MIEGLSCGGSGTPASGLQRAGLAKDRLGPPRPSGGRPPVVTQGDLIRIDITGEAFDAIAATLPELGHVRIGG